MRCMLIWDRVGLTRPLKWVNTESPVSVSQAIWQVHFIVFTSSYWEETERPEKMTDKETKPAESDKMKEENKPTEPGKEAETKPKESSKYNFHFSVLNKDIGFKFVSLNPVRHHKPACMHCMFLNEVRDVVFDCMACFDRSKHFCIANIS